MPITHFVAPCPNCGGKTRQVREERFGPGGNVVLDETRCTGCEQVI